MENVTRRHIFDVSNKKQPYKMENKTVVLSAYSYDYSEKSYKFMFGRNSFEFVPKSQVIFVENGKGGTDFDNGNSNYFELPEWLYRKLKGVEFYGIV